MMSVFANSGDDFVSRHHHHLNHFPEDLEKLFQINGSNRGSDNRVTSSIPTDILDTPKNTYFTWMFLAYPNQKSRYEQLTETASHFYLQVTVEDGKTLVIRSNGKRKREETEEDGCKYIRLERRLPHNLLRKFRLPEDANVAAITAKCDSGLLTVVVEKQAPQPKTKKVEVTIG